MSTDFNLPRIISGDTRQFDQLLEQLAQASRQTAAELRQTLASQLLTRLWHSTQPNQSLDPSLGPIVDQLINAIQPWLSEGSDFYTCTDHPLRHRLQQLTDHLSHWCPRDSKPSQQFVDKLRAMVEQVGSSPAEGAHQYLHDFNQWATKEAQRASMLAERLGASEAGQLRLLSIECQVLDALNDHLSQRPFPTEAQDSVVRVLKSELQHSLVTAGDDPAKASVWKYWQRLLPRLGEVFTGDGIEAEDQTLYSQIPTLISELERSLELPLSNPDAYGRWIDELCRDLMLAIQKKELACSLLPALEYPEGYSHSHTRVTQGILKQSQALQSGAWLIFKQDEDHWLRCQLAYKNTQSDQLLFVDQAGRKVMGKSLKDMALCLSTGLAIELQPPQLSDLIEQLLGKLIAQSQKLQEQLHAIAQARAQEAAAAEAERQQQAAKAAEQAMQEQLAARHAAARKAMAEARALAAEKEERAHRLAQEREQQARAARAEAEAQLIAAQDTVASLKVGAWLELTQANGKPQRAKLSVILAASGKYIFVDQVGRKLAEYQREQLIDLLQQNSIRLLRQGDNFEDQLAKVIRGLRKDISS